MVFQMKNAPKLSFAIRLLSIFIGCGLLILTQRYTLYFDLSTTKNLSPPTALTEQLSSATEPFNVTIFSSNGLSNELNIDTLARWIESISPRINVAIYDPEKYPAKADYFDISSDGVIVIEHNQKRQDIDLIEQIIINEAHDLENIQNVIARAFTLLVQRTPPQLLLIHSNQTPIFDSTSAMGLELFKSLCDDNFISIDAIHVDQLPKTMPQYDVVIFYKLTENARQHRDHLAKLYQQFSSTIIFNHPKFSSFINSIISTNDIQLGTEIIEAHTNHLMRSKNQLIVEYTSRLNQTFIGVFPFSSFIDYDSTAKFTSLATTDDDAFITLESDVIPGPFSLISQSNARKRTVVNNYLFLTNGWITQGDNLYILKDLIESHLDNSPILSARDTSNDFIILTRTNAYKLCLMLIFLPILVYVFIGIFFSKR